MSGTERQLPGASLLERLERRTKRRPRVGPSPTFFSRFKMADPWTVGATSEPGEATGLDYVYLSGLPFYAMMRRMFAKHRARRTLDRHQRVRAQRRPLRAASRLGHSTGQRAMFSFGGFSLSEQDMIVPFSTASQEEEPTPVRVVSGWGAPQPVTPRRARVAQRQAVQPTLVTIVQRDDQVSSRMDRRVVSSVERQVSSRAERPLARIGRRVQVLQRAQDPVTQLIQRSGVRMSPRLVQILEETATLPVEERVVRVRRAARRLGGVRRQIEDILEPQIADADATPISVVQGRVSAPNRQQRRGLRTVMSGSPMMRAIEHPPVQIPDALQERPSPRLPQRQVTPSAPRQVRVRTSVARAPASRAPRRAARATPASRSAERSPGDPPRPAESAPSALPSRIAPRPLTAHVAARVRQQDALMAPGRSIVPRVTPATGIEDEPHTQAASSVRRAVLRARDGERRTRSLLPQVIVRDEASEAVTSAASPVVLPSRRRGRTSRTAMSVQSPTQHLIAREAIGEPSVTSVMPKVTPTNAPGTLTGRPKQRLASQPIAVEPATTTGARVPTATQRVQQRLSRTEDVVERSVVPRVTRTRREETPGVMRAALERADAVEPVGRSSVPRVTRRPTIDAPTPVLPTFLEPAPVDGSAPIRTRPVTSAPPSTPVRSASRRSQAAEPAARSVLPRVTRQIVPTMPTPGVESVQVQTPVWAASRRSQAAEPAVRSVLPRVTRQIVPTMQALDAETPEVESVQPSTPVQSASRRSQAAEPVARSVLPRVTRQIVPTMQTLEVESTQPSTTAPTRQALSRQQIAEPKDGSVLPRITRKPQTVHTEAVAPAEVVQTVDGVTRRVRPAQRIVHRQEDGDVRTDAVRSSAEPRTRTVRRPRQMGPQPVTLRPTVKEHAPEEPTPMTQERVTVVRSPAATPARRRVAAVVAAAERSRRTPVTSESVRRATAPVTPRADAPYVDVAFQRASRSPVSYARRARTSPGMMRVIVIDDPTLETTPTLRQRPELTASAAAPSRTRPTTTDTTATASRQARLVTRSPMMDRSLERSVDHSLERSIDRPLERIPARAENTPTAPMPSNRTHWVETRFLPGERPQRRVRLSTTAEGVVVRAPDPVIEPDVAMQPRVRRQGTPDPVMRPLVRQQVEPDPVMQQRMRRRAALVSGDPTTEIAALPAPWSRPVVGRNRQARTSSRLPRQAMARTRRTASGTFVAQRAAATRGQRRQAMQGPSQSGFVLPQGPSLEADAPQSTSTRPPLPWTLEAVDVQSQNPALPVWAQRASGQPRVSGSDDFLNALARAGDVKEVVRVIFARSKEPTPMMRSLSSPVIQVIQQIREEAHRATGGQTAVAGQTGAAARGRIARTAEQTPLSRDRRRQVRNTRVAQTQRAMTGLRTLASAPTSEGVSEDRVMKLARRLRDLVHLAENRNRRDEARQGVRMAEDSGAARAEGSAAPAQAADGLGGEKRQVDIDALSQEVSKLVQQELSMQKLRRPDGSDDDIWGW
ncbi:MAG: hypothetical protein AAFV53_13220 [Myxococcota bacterium]